MIDRLMSMLRAAGLPGFRQRPPPECFVPEGLRLYAIGDIHGMAGPLEQAHERILADHARHGAGMRPVLIYLGDYIDRGPESCRVLDILSGPAPLPGATRHFLKGNHEAALLGFLEDPAAHADWLDFGGLETLESYGVRIPSGLNSRERPGALSAAMAQRMPPGHRAFLGKLELSADYGDYLFVHAGINPYLPLERQNPDDLMWIREPFLETPLWSGRRVVHGHTVSDRPVFRPNRIGIDTGAYLTGRLTVLALCGKETTLLA